MDEGDSVSNDVSNTRYIIFSACGYGNVGDDAIMLGTARYLITRQNATDLFIFSYSPEETRRLLEKAGLTSVATLRCGRFKSLLKALSSTTRRKRIMIGGGTLITNRTLFTLYYLIPAFLFKLFFSTSSDVYFFGVGAEEKIKRPLLKFMLSLVLRHSIKKALVRDNFTEDVLKHFANSTSTKVTAIGDPALFLKEWHDGNGANKKKDEDNSTLYNHTARIFVSARDLDMYSSDYHARCFANMFDELVEVIYQKTGMTIVINFVPFCIHKTSILERDDLFGEKIKSLMKYFDYFQIEKIDNPIEIMQKFNEADFCMCMRLHSLIFAYMTGRKCLAISYSPKVFNFAKDNDLPCIDISEVESQKKKVIDIVVQSLFVEDKGKIKSN
ncbi:MAG: polysaccharide pyruvyl transferase family protein [Thermoproteota archaeon]|nr:polysaccharide pyruvyl transferase family protein [Thermoproteota archaeon]